MSETSDITRILLAASNGDLGAKNQLLELVYGQLRQMAQRQISGEQAGLTLSATALVHEAWLRLERSPDGPSAFENRRHFYRAAAEAMRRILIEQARKKRRREALVAGVAFTAPGSQSTLTDDELIDLDEALHRLEAEDAEAAAVVKLRFFAGMTLEEAAEAMECSRSTAARHWAYAKAWLKSALDQTDQSDQSDQTDQTDHGR